MAIKVAGSTVINDSRILDQGGTYGLRGNYDNFHPDIVEHTGSNIDMEIPLYERTLTSNHTFSGIQNTFAGNTTTIIIDRSASGYTPTFAPSIFSFPSTPSWSSHRIWHVTITVADSNTFLCTAVGFDQQAISYTVTAPTSIDEGSSGTINVATTGVNNNWTLYWTVTPSADFATNSGSFTINNDAGSFTVTPTGDSTTEGSETGTIEIRTVSTSGTIVATDTFTINDTSTSPGVSYTVTAPTSIDEGSSGLFTVTTTGVTAGTYYWTVTPTSDFFPNSGNFTIYGDGSGAFSITPTADSTTEGSETGTIQIRTGSTSGTIVATDTFTINDTSTGSLTYSVTPPSTINEGSSGTFNVTTGGVTDGTTLYYTIAGTGLAGGAVAADFGGTFPSGSFTINSNAGSFTVTPTADSTTEGGEVATVQIRTGSTSGSIVDSDTFTINDTSTGSASYFATAPASINEGAAGTINITTAGVSSGTTLYWTVTPASDFSTTSGNFTIDGFGNGSFTVTPTADSTTEGSETGTIQIRTGSTSGTIVATDTFTINDTSQLLIPTTNFARINSSNDTTYISNTETSGIVFMDVQMHVRLRRQDNFVYYEARSAAAGYDTSNWYDTGGSASTLNTSYTTLGRFDLGGITAIKMNWSETSTPGASSGTITGNTSDTGATYAASDNSFQSISNGQSIGAVILAQSAAECYATNTATCIVTMDVTAQKSGYGDTTLGTYRHECRAVAVSNNCF